MSYYFGEIDALCDRILFAISQEKNIIFVVGSPLTAPCDHEGKGVLGVNAIVDLIKKEFSNSVDAFQSLEMLLRTSGQGSYQSAFQFLISRRGLDYANKIVRMAVSNSYNGVIEKLDNLASLEEAEKNISAWSLSPGVDSLGAVLSCLRKNFTTVLTTNFDPLIQVAIAKSGGTSFTTMLHREGNLHQTRADATHVVHLHGSWRGSDTLHTEGQLKQDRPQLKASLSNLARGALIVVIGYGGWDDIITRTLSELVMDDSIYPEILWTFYSESPDDILAQNNSLFEKLIPGIDRGRVSLYLHIDCHEFFPKLKEKIDNEVIGEIFAVSSSQGSMVENKDEYVAIFDAGEILGNPINALPKNEVWFGRTIEMAKLTNSKAKVVAITGIGGQGKSSLASTYFSRKKTEMADGFFDWKDCREQGNTINLAICGVIEKASRGVVDVAAIAKRPISDLISILISELNGRHGVIVFDNVDNYIDLEINAPLGALETIVNGAISLNHGMVFMFTARPMVRIDSPDFLELRLLGLDQEDALILFEYRYGKKIDKTVFSSLYKRTAGHPLWLSIIAAQCFSTDRTIESVLEAFDGEDVVLPKQMLRQVWEKLNENQKHVLRTLAGLERPESEANIEEMTELNYNRLNKALLKLRSMCLIERKVTQNKIDMVDLHPLIRKFVREEFPRKDRESFIGKVIVYLDRRIFGYRKKLSGPVPNVVLEMWVHKIDLQINSGMIDGAIDSLVEIIDVIDRNGLSDELVRLSKRIFLEVDWFEAISESGNFDKLFNASIRSMIEAGGIVEVDGWLDKYEESIAGKGAQYINLCDIQAYKFWFWRDYDDSILWAERGEALKVNSDVDTDFHCRHTLALAQRDSGKTDLALKYFMDGLSEEEIFSAESAKNKVG